jgi:benzoyl-CoA reductase/2-hydroxyglutaryl-CoA dehydratase subunit BcrC/BadD/HgdB
VPVNASHRFRVLEGFTEAAGGLVKPAVQGWKDGGGRVVGYFCCSVPEEIMSAAGLLPVRIRATGSTETDLADAYFRPTTCSFARHCFDTALRGGYGFADGVVWANTCDVIRRLYDNWKDEIETPFLQILSLPKKTGEKQVAWYREELENLKKALEVHFAVEIPDDRLWESIILHNETRRLQRQLYDLRKGNDPPITGAESLAVMIAGTAMPKEQYNQALEQLLDELAGGRGSGQGGARLMLEGSMLDDPAYVKVIEDQGGLVVTDALCFGSRIMWNDVDETVADPLEALARYHLGGRPSCARMIGEHPRRLGYIQDMIREFRVDAVISERLTFCDISGYEQFLLGSDFKAGGIPYLQLDREYMLGGVGQMRTRVQAFLESIEE